MKKILNIMVLSTLMACLVPANAQDFNQKRIETPIQSQQIMTTGASYSGTVYEPFSNATPAEQSYTPAQAPSGRRRGYDANGNWVPESEDFGGGAETGASNQFPLGDALLPLLMMAMLFAGVTYYRKRRARA